MEYDTFYFVAFYILYNSFHGKNHLVYKTVDPAFSTRSMRFPLDGELNFYLI